MSFILIGVVMFIFRNLFAALADVLHLVITLYIYIVIARAVLSWFQPNPFHPVVRFIRDVTEPPLAWIRRYIPLFGGLDLSPVVLIFALIFIDRFVVATLRTLAMM